MNGHDMTYYYSIIMASTLQDGVEVNADEKPKKASRLRLSLLPLCLEVRNAGVEKSSHFQPQSSDPQATRSLSAFFTKSKEGAIEAQGSNPCGHGSACPF